MFYSNALAKATSGARKKAHGGSGISGDGNAYSPSSAYSISVRSIHAHITFTLSCCFLGVPSCTLRFSSFSGQGPDGYTSHQPLAAFLYAENKDKEDTLLTSDELYHNYVRCDVFHKPTNA